MADSAVPFLMAFSLIADDEINFSPYPLLPG